MFQFLRRVAKITNRVWAADLKSKKKDLKTRSTRIKNRVTFSELRGSNDHQNKVLIFLPDKQ
jgi:hypothetical protein